MAASRPHDELGNRMDFLPQSMHAVRASASVAFPRHQHVALPLVTTPLLSFSRQDGLHRQWSWGGRGQGTAARSWTAQDPAAATMTTLGNMQSIIEQGPREPLTSTMAEPGTPYRELGH